MSEGIRLNIYLETLGCDSNTVDSEWVAGVLNRRGHTIVDRAHDADVLLVNTCGFIEAAKKESIDAIFDQIAEKRPDQRLFITGCLAQRYGSELAKLIPEAEAILGVNDYARLPEILESDPEERKMFTGGHTEWTGEGRERKRLSRPHTAALKIAEGCDHACSYCAIPSIRGSYRSRPIEMLVREAEQLAEGGCKELVLVAQDVTAYGSDWAGSGHLVSLIEALAEIEQIAWIRLMYCYEHRIDDALIDLMAREPRICPYLDIPLQHASASVLRAMHRVSTPASIKETIKKLRKRIPHIALRTTLITGFPGETEEDFSTLLTFVQDMKFERLGVFTYSCEEGTPAAELTPQVPEHVRERRRDEIMALQQQISLKHNRKFVGRTLEVLIDERHDDGTYEGRTVWDAPEVDNAVLFTCDRPLKAGDMVPVTVTDAFDYDLVGVCEEGGRV